VGIFPVGPMPQYSIMVTRHLQTGMVPFRKLCSRVSSIWLTQNYARL
jgi:hypothetical protein